MALLLSLNSRSRSSIDKPARDLNPSNSEISKTAANVLKNVSNYIKFKNQLYI